MLKNKKQKGFSLIELILVLGLSTLAFVSLVQWEVRKSEITRAEIAGEQFAEVGKALASYIAREQLNIAHNIPPGSSRIIPIEVLRGVSSGPFIGRQYLPETFSAVNSFGTQYQIQIRRTPGGLIEGLITSANPICEKGTSLQCPSANNPIRYDWIGAAMKKMGAQSGMSRNNTTMSGYNAGWILTNADFNVIDQEGKIGYRVSSTDTALYDSQYLRLDGTSTMLGNLNMGNYSIENATNISYNGWLQGYGILANTIRSAFISNEGNIQTQSLHATNIIKAGSNQLPTNMANIGNGDIVVDRNIYARDVFLGDPNHENRISGPVRTIPNAWLSDLLPRYSSRGVLVVRNGDLVTKPSCGSGGRPRIEVIPQLTWSNGRVYGEIYLYDIFPNIRVFWDLVSYNPNYVWANDWGNAWQVRFDTTNFYSHNYTWQTRDGTIWSLRNYQPYFDMMGLAHVYCDYGAASY